MVHGTTRDSRRANFEEFILVKSVVSHWRIMEIVCARARAHALVSIRSTSYAQGIAQLCGAQSSREKSRRGETRNRAYISTTCFQLVLFYRLTDNKCDRSRFAAIVFTCRGCIFSNYPESFAGPNEREREMIERCSRCCETRANRHRRQPRADFIPWAWSRKR